MAEEDAGDIIASEETVEQPVETPSDPTEEPKEPEPEKSENKEDSSEGEKKRLSGAQRQHRKIERLTREIEELKRAKPAQATDADPNEARINAEVEKRTAEKSWEAQKEITREFHDDFDDVIEANKIDPTRLVAEKLLKSKVGGRVAYFLAQNPEEFEDLNDIDDPIELAIEWKRIEAEAKAYKGKAAVKKAPPPPLKPVKPGVTASFDPDKADVDSPEFRKWVANMGR